MGAKLSFVLTAPTCCVAPSKVTLMPLNAALFRWLVAMALASASALGHTAPFEDTLAQRTQACTACHGNQGRAAADGYYPRLAGKPAGYLYNQLLNFKAGRRHYGLMTQLVDPLTDAYLMEIALYFSQIEAPYPPPVAASTPAAVLEKGRQLVMQGDAARRVPACVQCHGQAMTGVLPATPGLLGLPRDYVNAQLGAWKAGQRRAHAPDCMKAVVARLSDEDIFAASSWLAAQAVPADAHAAAQRPALATGGKVVECGTAPVARNMAKSPS
jgi:cytochrome c553